MHEMQTIVTDVRGVCPSVCLSRGSTRRRMQSVRGAFAAAFAKLLWHLVSFTILISSTISSFERLNLATSFYCVKVHF